MSDPSSALPRDTASMHTMPYRRSYAACPCYSRVEQIRVTRPPDGLPPVPDGVTAKLAVSWSMLTLTQPLPAMLSSRVPADSVLSLLPGGSPVQLRIVVGPSSNSTTSVHRACYWSAADPMNCATRSAR
jgi:hypothetical protein